MIWIGIDPGTHTGLAVWDSDQSRFLVLATTSIHRAIILVREMAINHPDNVSLVYEDAWQRTWFGKENTDAKKQGAGSVKRDCSIWKDFCKDLNISFQAVSPSKGMTKWTPEYFRMVTGWTGRTSEHSRDAALLVFDR